MNQITAYIEISTWRLRQTAVLLKHPVRSPVKVIVILMEYVYFNSPGLCRGIAVIYLSETVSRAAGRHWRADESRIPFCRSMER